MIFCFVKLLIFLTALGKFSYQPETTSIADGFYHRLNCSIEKASPKPTITWFKNDAPVLNTSAYHYLTITNNGGSEMHPLSVTHSNLSVVVLPSGVLELGPVSAIDAGDYYCSASNGIKTRRSSLATLTILPKTGLFELLISMCWPITMLLLYPTFSICGSSQILLRWKIEHKQGLSQWFSTFRGSWPPSPFN